MKQYKLILVLKSSLKDAEQKKLLDSIKAMLGKVKFTKEDSWGQKPLAYAIKRELSGVFEKIQFETENVSPDFEKKLQTNDSVLRHLLLKV